MSTTNFPRAGPLRVKRVLLSTALMVMLAALAGCRSAALSFAADAVASSGTTYASDEDPELVRDAVPFGLKTMEGLLERNPKHVELLLALASGFTQYGYAFVQADADVACVKKAAARRGLPAGMRSRVDSARWRPVAVASSAPRKPTQSVKCSV